jgi:hypothetical protein
MREGFSHKKQPAIRQAVVYIICIQLREMPLASLHDVGSKYGKYLVKLIAVCMNVQIDGLGKIKAEDAHDGLRIDDIAAGYEIEIEIEAVDVIHKCLDLVDGIKRNFNGFHL